MRVALLLLAGLALFETSCGNSSSSDLFAPTTTGGSQGGTSASGAGGNANGESTATTGTGVAGRGGPGGAAGRSVDAGAAGGGPDGGTVHRVHCGNVSCFAPDQLCCIPDNGTAHCEAVLGGSCAANGDRVNCDDRTDCTGPGSICCAEDI